MLSRVRCLRCAHTVRATYSLHTKTAFYFQDGSSCLVSEVTNVNYQNGETIVVAPVASFPDSLTIEVGEKVYSYTNVENYKEAQARILALMLESAKSGQS